MNRSKQPLIVALIFLGSLSTTIEASKHKENKKDRHHKTNVGYHLGYGYGYFDENGNFQKGYKPVEETPAASTSKTTKPAREKEHKKGDMCRQRCELKVRGSAFIPTGDLFRDIYGDAAGNFDVEFAVRVYSYLQAWANIDYMQAHGDSLGFCNSTSIRIVNGSLGLKSPYDVNDWLRVYLGIGPTFGGVRISDKSQFSGCSSCSKSSIGFVAKSGLDFYFRNRGFVDVFVDYVYQQAKFKKHVNLNGVRIGAGIGFTF